MVSVRVRKMFHRTSKEKDTVDRVKEREREKKNLKKGTRNAVVSAAETILAPPKT